MRIDSTLFSCRTKDPLKFEQEARTHLEELHFQQEDYFESFHSLFTHSEGIFTVEELKLKELAQKLEVKAAQAREAICLLSQNQPDKAEQLQLEYEAQLNDLHAQLSEMAQLAIAKANKEIESQYKELAAHLPINPAKALELQMLIQRCQTLIVLTREQLQFIQSLLLF